MPPSSIWTIIRRLRRHGRSGNGASTARAGSAPARRSVRRSERRIGPPLLRKARKCGPFVFGYVRRYRVGINRAPILLVRMNAMKRGSPACACARQQSGVGADALEWGSRQRIGVTCCGRRPTTRWCTFSSESVRVAGLNFNVERPASGPGAGRATGGVPCRTPRRRTGGGAVGTERVRRAPRSRAAVAR